ncbi:MAG: DUF4270 domain-containing protein [Prevotellaceae bacterium]|nr:DUF4270 domain-containing protein [Prevotellaceae bacterium]
MEIYLLQKTFKRLVSNPLWIVPLLFATLAACSNETYFNLGSSLVEPKFKMVYIDTFAVKLSTIKLDSIPTHNQSTILVGKYSDVNTLTGEALTGTTTASSYIEISRPTYPEFANNVITEFDSLVLEMRFNGFYMGDTLNNMHLYVYRLAERINRFESSSQTFYNVNSFRTEASPLAEVRFPINPRNTRDSIYLPGEIAMEPVRIRLPDALGKDMFEKMKSKATEFENSERFLDYFNGLAFKAGSEVQTIVGFRADASFKIRLYYHQKEEFDINEEIVFSVNAAKQFNNIVSDRTGTGLDMFTREIYEIDAAQTQNQSYIMAGDGLYTKVEFPNISQILEFSDYGAVERAILEIKPVYGTYQKYTVLPQNLSVFATVESGEAESQLLDSQNQAMTGNLVVDAQFWDNTAYNYDVSGFIQNQIFATNNEKMYLTLKLSDDVMRKSTARLVIGNSNHWLNHGNQTSYNRIKLKLYYNMYNK